ncbi:thioredoxin-like 1-1, chloroplastic isoform X1 [Olea europaea var. sylvestris]|uniref:Thioredoxin-like 1-1, chloroplastic n=1 Tax=Olea europaea subsp. europaea TaxID=158383 RepID=A0A8S0U6H5_OLEEU|nr:thioredoxin-like 1-1, chloroplastic isoform X1 [Olea europaea var. sylvestris]CAA3013878.1 thioredoxin-like 1-1, chloroplastic [Olea europaea subsp. europaea]
MADVISQTSLILPCVGHQSRHGVAVFPSKSPISLSATRYSSLKLQNTALASSSSLVGTEFFARGNIGAIRRNPRPPPPNAHVGFAIGKAQKWWEKGVLPNMKEVTGAQDLVDSLLHAGDKLVVVDFFSPGCGGCKALHPKICQLAEMNPHVQFLQVNYDEHKAMCYALNIHVLPFFRFYRGAHGRLCSFSCTNATIKKFKDALAKHSPDRCSLCPTKGLEEKELLALSANRDLSFVYDPLPKEEGQVFVPEREREEILSAVTSPLSHEAILPLSLPLPLPLPLPSTTR